MADDFKALAVFAAVAEAGSFSAAARRLKLSTSVVSHHVSKLEARLGVTLFYRSTRSLSVTAEGEKVLPSARQMVASADEALDVLAEDTDQLVGALRIAMPTFGLHMSVHQAVWAFARRHPMVALSLSSSDRQVDLVRDGFDVGIRLGELADSSLKVRRIGSFSRVLVASPEYLSGAAPVRTPEDLKDHAFLTFAMLPATVVLQKAGEQVRFDPQNVRVEVDSVLAAKAALLAGLGMQRLPVSEVQGELERGELVEVLPGWRPPELGVYAVWPDSGAQRRLTRRFVDALVDAGK
ncbi:MAG: LysR family transcriptional regulator [Paracoccaceae bacterium]